jgi:hypothetical protein
MDDSRDAAIIALMLVLAVCLAVFILKVGASSGELVERLFPRV